MTMPDNTARKRLKQKMLERWENEGGKIATEPKAQLENNSAGDPGTETACLSPSSKNPVRTSVSSAGRRKTR